MKKCYIAGKISSLTEEEWRANFEQAEAEVREMGFEPVNPVKLPHHHDKSWTSFMREDLAAMLTCDYLYAQRNWITSDGARIEVKLAIDLGLIVIYQAQSQKEAA